MAVARYQPNSLSGLKLSRVVLAPFAQLAPHREVELEHAENDHQLELVVRGVSYLRNSSVAGPSRILATVEEKCSDVDEPGLGSDWKTDRCSAADGDRRGIRLALDN